MLFPETMIDFLSISTPFSNNSFWTNLRVVSEKISTNNPMINMIILCLVKLIFSFDFIISSNAIKIKAGM